MADITPQPQSEETTVVQNQNWKPDHIIKQETESRKAKIRILKFSLFILVVVGIVFSGIWYLLFHVNQFTLSVISKGDPEIVLAGSSQSWARGSLLPLQPGPALTCLERAQL